MLETIVELVRTFFVRDVFQTRLVIKSQSGCLLIQLTSELGWVYNHKYEMYVQFMVWRIVSAKRKSVTST
jgi:hypothetical protein